MALSKTPILPNSSPVEPKQQEHQSPHCTLKWRQRQLLVSLEQQNKRLHLPALENKHWLVECLQHSSVRLICLDVALGEANLKFWADACEQANKPVFLRLPRGSKLFKQRRSPLGWFKWLIDWSVAVLLLLLLSPVILGLMALISIQSSEPIFSWQWRVGERGKLFRLFKFRTTVGNIPTPEQERVSERKNLQHYQDNYQTIPLGYWIQNYGLDQLPRLWSVLRGEMRLVSSRSWTLEQIVQLGLEELQQMKAVRESKEQEFDREKKLQPNGAE